MSDSLEYLIDQIEDRRKNIMEALGDGSAKDFHSYQLAVGEIRGLLFTQSLIKDLAKTMEEFDD